MGPDFSAMRSTLLAGAVLLAAPITAQEVVKFLHQPNVSHGKIAFCYHGDIWVANADGSDPYRLTNHVANDVLPRFSPDGTSIAFSSNRMGNNDIWVIPVEGGTPRQITFNTAGDTMAYWTPDGTEILFASSRSPHPFLNPLYRVPVAGGIPVAMKMDLGATGMISQDGSTLAFNRNPISSTRKHYRGNRQADIWVQDLESMAIRQLTDLNPREHRSHVHDGHPMWGADGMIYFVSERDSGIYNIWRISPQGGQPSQVTRHTFDGVRSPSISPDGRTIVYENEFELWKLQVPDGAPQKVSINLAFEAKENEFEFLETSDSADGFSPSPDGEHVAVDYHGEIFLVPSDEDAGDKVQITRSPWRDRYQVFSPDGTKLAYITDSSHEEEVWVYDLATQEHRQVSRHESTKRPLTWSPDSSSLFMVGSNELVMIDVASGENTSLGYNVDGGYTVTQITEDGKWLVYSRSDEDRNSDVFLVEMATGTAQNLTAHPSRDGGGQLTPDGKTLLFTSNRNGTTQLFAVPLQRRVFDPDDPLNKHLLEEAANATPAQLEITVDADGIDERAVALTSEASGVGTFFLSDDGKTIHYVSGQGGGRRGRRGGQGGQPGTRALYSIGIDGQDRKKVADGAFNGLTPSGDGKTLFFREGNGIHKMAINGQNKVQVTFDLRVKVDHRGQWEQVFEEAWRSMKYRFYDEDMHDFDWDAMKARYKPYLQYVGSNEDVNELANRMIGELNASHVGVRGQPSRAMESLYTTQLLGFEMEPEGEHYRVSHIYRDGPADKEWISLSVGDYVLAVDGQEIAAVDNYWKILNETINDYVEVKVAAAPTGGTRTFRVRPVTSLRDIQYREWVADNRDFVEKYSDGVIAYVHIRSMNQASLQQFEREVDQYHNAKGMIIDIRYNGGGNIDEPLLDIMERVPYAFVNQRSGGRKWGRRHRQAIAGPKVMMINHRSGSDAEMTPAGFRVLGLGSLVGTPTAAGVIWTGSYSLMNGGSIRTPGSLAVTYDPSQPNNYGINLENFGVEPDVWVENTPQDELNGEDKELIAAVDEALRMLRDGSYQYAPSRERGGR